MNQGWRIYVADHHSAFRGKGVLTHTATGENLLEAITENVMLSAISESPKEKHPLALFMGGTWTSQIHRDRKQRAGAGGGGGGEMGSYVLGTEPQFCQMGKFWRWMGVTATAA